MKNIWGLYPKPQKKKKLGMEVMHIIFWVSKNNFCLLNITSLLVTFSDGIFVNKMYSKMCVYLKKSVCI